MEAFLRVLLPRFLPAECSIAIHAFQGKSDLIGKLPDRLRGYAAWLPKHWRIIVVVDRDDDDCQVLKAGLELIAEKAGLRTRTGYRTGWRIANRIAIEELEAWYFGEWDAVRLAFPRVARKVTRQKAYRNPDAIVGGTWEAFERVLRRHGYFAAGLRKLEAARTIAEHFDPARATSGSYRVFHEAVLEAANVEPPRNSGDDFA